MKQQANKDRGFTLVEIAIVLVIIGLLLGGILKGQELINNAKVRAIADRQNSLKVAWFSFIDRFAAIPGDHIQASTYITGAANGNGDGFLLESDAPLAFQHLASAGYLRCGHCTETNQAATIKPTAANSLVNNYGGVMSIWHDSTHYATPNTGTAAARLQVHTGPRIPSNILAEVDRKIDDGVPNSGDMRFNEYDPTGTTTAPVGECTKTDGTGATGGALADTADFWRPANSEPPVYQNCGASVFI